MGSRPVKTGSSTPSRPTAPRWARSCSLSQHRCFCVFGLLERDGARLFNACVLAGPDGLVGGYRKVHLPYLGIDMFADPGDRPFAVHDAGGLKIGMHICYDGAFPETARVLTLLGADLLVLPTNWPTHSECAAEHMIPTRAMENTVYVMSVNRVGEESGFGSSAPARSSIPAAAGWPTPVRRAKRFCWPTSTRPWPGGSDWCEFPVGTKSTASPTAGLASMSPSSRRTDAIEVGWAAGCEWGLDEHRCQGIVVRGGAGRPGDQGTPAEPTRSRDFAACSSNSEIIVSSFSPGSVENSLPSVSTTKTAGISWMPQELEKRLSQPSPW